MVLQRIVRAQNVDDLVLDHVLDGGAAGTEVVAGVKCAGLLAEGAANGGGHGHADVGVDVDLADGQRGGLAELLLGNADGVGHLSAVLVDLGDELLGNRRSTVENDGEAGEAATDLLENVKAERRGHQNALFVAGALRGGELVGAVGGADGDGEGVDTGAVHEVLDLLGAGVGGVLGHDVVLDAGENAQLTLDDHAVGVCVLHDLAGQGDVVLVGVVGAVDHDGGEAAVDAGLADLEVGAVIEVERQINAAVGNGGLRQSDEIRMLGVLTGTGRHLQDDGGLDLACGLGDGLNDLHVVDVECADGVAALVGLLEHLGGGNKSHGIYLPSRVRRDGERTHKFSQI